MTWHKITFSRDQIADGEYERLHNQIRDVIFNDPRQYQNVAIFMARENVGFTQTAFFSPDAVKDFSPLLASYSPESCEKPLASEVIPMLSIDASNSSRLLE
jgi:hypothetical protein